QSGFPANGTGIRVTLPLSVAIFGGVDAVAFNAFLVNNWVVTQSIEAGVAYGWQDFCGRATYYFHPYGTKANGDTENANCGLALTQGSSYVIRAWNQGSGINATSAVLTTGGQTLYSHSWGVYVVDFGLNLTMAEIHDDNVAYSKPGFSSPV